MIRIAPLALVLLLSGAIIFPATALAQADVDGPDCGRPIQDFGDAPEDAEYFGVVGHFPTCLTPTTPGDQETVCPPRSTPPGTTGYVKHVQTGESNYWFGGLCDPANLSGVDSDADGKYSYPGPGPSACDPDVPTDPPPGTVKAGQDEYGGGYGGGDGDGGIFTNLLGTCGENYVQFATANCGPPRTAYLNILVDVNFDGDWNDNVSCEVCGHEWGVKNHPIEIPSGCQFHDAPPFQGGDTEGFGAWMRLSLTDEPVDDDYPWAGSANRPGGAYMGGETEDRAVDIINPLPVRPSSWGEIKTLYR